MVMGHNIATCFHCHKQWVVGDCIPSVCEECNKTGHTSIDCPICKKIEDERRKRIDEAIANKNKE